MTLLVTAKSLYWHLRPSMCLGTSKNSPGITHYQRQVLCGHRQLGQITRCGRKRMPSRMLDACADEYNSVRRTRHLRGFIVRRFCPMRSTRWTLTPNVAANDRRSRNAKDSRSASMSKRYRRWLGFAGSAIIRSVACCFGESPSIVTVKLAQRSHARSCMRATRLHGQVYYMRSGRQPPPQVNTSGARWALDPPPAGSWTDTEQRSFPRTGARRAWRLSLPDHFLALKKHCSRSLHAS